MIGVPYREAIGSLLFLEVITRPYIAVAVSILSKHVQCPRPFHWEGIKRVLRYKKGTMSKGLTYNGADLSPVLTIYCDADWETDPEDRHSRSGLVCFLVKNLVSWYSRKQSIPSVASCDAEYVSLFEAGRDAVWIWSLLCELGLFPGSIPTQIQSQRQSNINSMGRGRTPKSQTCRTEIKSQSVPHIDRTDQNKLRGFYPQRRRLHVLIRH
jgi:hypothetical protein